MLSSRIFLMRMATINQTPFGTSAIYIKPATKMAFGHMDYINRFGHYKSTGDCLINNANSSSVICKRYYASSERKMPQVPSKDVVLKTSWKVVAMVWDFAEIIIRFSWNFIQKQVIENVHVQKYWEVFLKKLDDARRSKW